MMHPKMHSTLPTDATPTMRTRPLADAPALASKAVQSLCESKAHFALQPDEARVVLPFLRWVSFTEGAYLYREGDDSRTSYMLLLLEGDVTVDTRASGREDRVAIASLGPGSLIGEMALLDGSPRSTTCIAITAVQAAGLSQGGLDRLAQDHPAVAFKLMVYVARNTADRLRAVSEQLTMVDQVIASLHDELAQLRKTSSLRP
ncbi:MAG: hypothetical protein CFE43_20305 [Burkholderiales bacterium PBB3]|nr:MAG: hypothetical protein CFE43_20305 [Burkholderiales bacterium PBB3]